MLITKSVKRLLLVFAILGSGMLFAQSPPAYPKLVVGIVIDQMRFDYLYKYRERYGQDGFNRLMREGYNFKNTNYPYAPTFTAPGHSSIYTGTTPSVHGIIDNSWFDRDSGKIIENVSDTTVSLVGSARPNPAGASPHNLLTTTITDQLRMASNFRSKVISISLKDRGAILPGGHAANAAYWHDLETSPGYFVSSTYYMEALPDWVSKFNSQGKSDAYLNTTWNTLYPLDTYVQSAPDDNPYERAIGGKSIPTFPYDFKSIRERYKDRGGEYQFLWLSPYGNSLLTEFALETLKNERLGQGKFTDFLCMSYTVSDVIGHTLGPQSVELEDTYLRLDKEIAQLLNSLDASPGKGNYVLFLTADHGAVPVVSYLKDNKLPGGVASIPRYKYELTNYLNSKYGAFEWIQRFESEHVYLNHRLIAERKLNPQDLEQDIASFLVNMDGISWALTAHQLQSEAYPDGMKSLLQKGYDPKRSGDVLLSFDPGFVPQTNASMTVDKMQGTTHGSGYTYDRHVPLLWYGKGIPSGESVRSVSPTDIAVTLALMLDIQFPSGSDAQPLLELFLKK